MKKFTLTTEHVKLLRRMCVGWQDCETGAPEIDPKRPYGNSSVDVDVAEILGWPLDGDDGYGPCLSSAQREHAMALHRETETALQVVLASGSFVPGVYVAGDYRRNWRKT